MAVEDDLRRLEQEDIVYLSWTASGGGISGAPPSLFSAVFYYGGRLHQSNSGSWVFKTADTNQLGLVGIDLGAPGNGDFTSTQTPGVGITIQIAYPTPAPPTVPGGFVRFELVFITQTLPSDILT
jgi:hypothetical protein